MSEYVDDRRAPSSPGRTVSVPVLHAMAHDTDATARDEIMAALGDLAGVSVFGQWVLGATYHRPGTSKGGIILTQRQTTQDRLEGKVFLLLKAGPKAFPSDLLAKWHGVPPAPGHWFYALPSDGIEVSIQGLGAVESERLGRMGWPCRMFLADDIVGLVDHPGMIV